MIGHLSARVRSFYSKKCESLDEKSKTLNHFYFTPVVTMHRSSNGHIGFIFSNGKITSIVKDSSAARNGLLINHQLLEVNGQNVVGMKDKELTSVLNNANEQTITVTIIPSMIYDHMMKKLVFLFISIDSI